jgi:GNAT superfamily N-acetyltransferase
VSAVQVIRRVDEEDWADLRAVRLAALADSPDAFGSSLASEQEQSEMDWREWTREDAVFLAYRSGTPIGMAAGIDGDTDDERRLVAAWVDPDHRRSGVASALVAALEQWARDDGASRLMLWVTRANESAVDLYRRRGFLPTGQSKPLPSNPALVHDQLVLELA